MAIEFDIRVGNNTVRITVGGGQAATANSTDQGGSSPGASSGNSGGGGPGSGVGGPLSSLAVIGPIVIDGSNLQSGIQGANDQGGSSPGASSGNSGGGGPNNANALGGSSPGASSGNSGGGGPNNANALGGSSPGASSGNSGGGGPGSGSGYGGTVVIGPIVITNGSGQASAAADPPSAQVLSLSAPTGITTTPRAAIFDMQDQKESEWCWSAVAVSMNNYLDPNQPGVPDTWSQQSLATDVLALEMQWSPPVDCGGDPNPMCDHPARLDTALTVTENLRAGGARFNRYLDFASIKSWLDVELPIGARIAWPAGGAHFVAFSGYQEFADGEQLVMVQDPLYKSGFHDYRYLLGQYIYGGSWQDTYLTTP
jgi:hypothetical protein